MELLQPWQLQKNWTDNNSINLILVKMKKNIGTIDKVIRSLIAVIVLILYFTHVTSGTLAVIPLILAGVFVVTSLLGFCPLYWLFGLSTRKIA